MRTIETIRSELADLVGSGNIETYTTREAWLEARTRTNADGLPLLGASDVYQVLGFCPPDWGTPYKVWANRNRPEAVNERTNSAMDIGRDWEAIAFRSYLENTPGAVNVGEPLTAGGQVFRVIECEPALLAVSPDAIVAIPDPSNPGAYRLGLVEIKIPHHPGDLHRKFAPPQALVGPLTFNPNATTWQEIFDMQGMVSDEFGPPAPLMYLAQVATQWMACKNAGLFVDFIDIWAWVGPNVHRRVRIEFPPEFVAGPFDMCRFEPLDRHLLEWREGFLCNPHTPPPTVPEDADTLSRALIGDWRQANAQGVQAPTRTAAQAIEAYARAAVLEKSASAAKDAAKHVVIAELTGANAQAFAMGKTKAQITTNGQFRVTGGEHAIGADFASVIAAEEARITNRPRPKMVTWGDFTAPKTTSGEDMGDIMAAIDAAAFDERF